MALIIAEVGSVHDGSLGNARCLIRAAAACGADAVKFQTHIASAETLPGAPNPPYFEGEDRYAYFARTAFSTAEWRTLRSECSESGVEFLSSAFSEEAVALLEDLDVGRYKVPSGEVTNLPLLHAIGRTGHPILLSSGMSSWSELDAAVGVLLKYHQQITVLQCTSVYPCPYEQVGLNIMLEMRDRYHLAVGLSDHTLTPYASFAAVALGATVIEKHFTFSRQMYGSDAAHSLEPSELAQLVDGVRAIEQMQSHLVNKDAVAVEMGEMKNVFQKSVVSLEDIPKGAVIAPHMVGVKKPGSGIPAAQLDRVVGRRVARDIPRDTLLSESDFDA